MRIYLDTCILNRLTDEPTQDRIATEAECCERILELIYEHKIEWVASTVLDAELRRNPNPERRSDSLQLLVYAEELVRPSMDAILRARDLQANGYGAVDALHLAVAEEVEAQALLTTDDRFCRMAQRSVGFPKVEVMNPVEWGQREGLWKPRHT